MRVQRVKVFQAPTSKATGGFHALLQAKVAGEAHGTSEISALTGLALASARSSPGAKRCFAKRRAQRGTRGKGMGLWG